MAITKRQYRIYQRNPHEFDAECAEWYDEDDDKGPRVRHIGECYKTLAGAKSAVKRYSQWYVYREIGRFEWIKRDEDYWTAEGLV